MCLYLGFKRVDSHSLRYGPRGAAKGGESAGVVHHDRILLLSTEEVPPNLFII